MDPAPLRPALDRIWLDAAAKLGIPVARGGDAYVHWDGSTLFIADDEHLDADDTVAQLVLHEICHAYVQGPELSRTPDWGLDNTHSGDAVNEAAAVRVQAHLLGAFGLRDVLHPTTGVRDFYDALPDDAFLPADDESARLARIAVTRLAQRPLREIIREALDATQRLVAPRLHDKSGHPIGRSGRRCGDCAFRTQGGMCRQSARRAFVGPSEEACTRWEGPLDCLACGACCRSAYEVVAVHPRERMARRHPDLVWLDGKMLAIRRSGDRCVVLDGPDGGPYHCRLYSDRPSTCRDYERAGRHCLEARRRVGLSF